MSDRGMSVPNLYRTLAHSPTMLKAWTDFTWPLRNEVVSPRPLRELIIMRVAQVTKATYEWAHHWPMAIANGVGEEQLVQLSEWERSDCYSDDERVALRYTDAITAMAVSDAVFEEVRRAFSPEVIIELTLTASFYTNLARVLQALDIDLEPGHQTYELLPLPRMDDQPGTAKDDARD
jgi:4-carboxymuconolactone decarboxylase